MLNDIAGFNIEPTNICTLKCPGCSRTQFINQWPNRWQNHSLDIDNLLNFLDVDLTGKSILLCGNYGDPIYHPDFINFVKKFKDRNADISIVTNGSHKKDTWWQELVECLSENDRIVFSIDGTPENFTEYRINADWSSIKTAIDVCVRSPVSTVWKYIPFSYNQDNIDEVKELSKQLGMDDFQLLFSDRFDEKTNYLKPADDLLGGRYQSQTEWRTTQSVKVIPKCSNQKEHFITAEGFYSACCQLTDYRFYYKSTFGKNKQDYDITKTTLSELLQRGKTVEFYQNLQSNPGCQFNCPG